MKKCKYCGEEKEETSFHVAATVKGKTYRRLKCNDCYRETKNKLKKEKRAWLVEEKKKMSCADCGCNDHRVLQFHHPNDDKEGNVGDMISRYSLDNVKKEMAKCEILCANCHMIKHYEERNLTLSSSA